MDITHTLYSAYAKLGNFRKALAIAEHSNEVALCDIADKLIENNRDKEALKLIKFKFSKSPISPEEELLRRTFGEKDKTNYTNYVVLLRIIRKYAELGKANKAVRLISMLDDIDAQIELFACIAYFQRRRGNRKQALKYLSMAKKLQEKRRNLLPAYLKRAAKVVYMPGIRGQLGLAEEYALIGNKKLALEIAGSFLGLAYIKPKKKSYNYLRVIRDLAKVYELCGKNALALRIAKAGDWRSYQDYGVADKCHDAIEKGQRQKAVALFKLIKHKWLKLPALDYALNYSAIK